MSIKQATAVRRGRVKRTRTMTRHQLRQATTLPLAMAELAVASWQTIMLRSALMAQGTCSTAEYQRMVWEKLDAAQRSAMALVFSGGASAAGAVLSPWVRAARANAKRLGKR
jgi:hypothetical protein